jgi:enamine deaminase RidA (YjgF/YER057c/UK114 family)
VEKRILNPPALAKSSGYNHGIVTEGGRLLFLAGQPGLNASGKIEVPSDLVAQFARALSNLQVVVEAAGGALADIVKMTIYVRDKDAYKANLKALATTWHSFFGHYYPAVTLVEVSGLFDDGALVELDAIAVIQDKI